LSGLRGSRLATGRTRRSPGRTRRPPCQQMLFARCLWTAESAPCSPSRSSPSPWPSGAPGPDQPCRALARGALANTTLGPATRWWPAPTSRCAVPRRIGNVLPARGLTSPPDHYGGISVIWGIRMSSAGIAVLDGQALPHRMGAVVGIGRQRDTTTALKLLQQLALGDSKVSIIQNAFLTQLIQLT